MVNSPLWVSRGLCVFVRGSGVTDERRRVGGWCLLSIQATGVTSKRPNPYHSDTSRPAVHWTSLQCNDILKLNWIYWNILLACSGNKLCCAGDVVHGEISKCRDDSQLHYTLEFVYHVRFSGNANHTLTKTCCWTVTICSNYCWCIGLYYIISFKDKIKLCFKGYINNHVSQWRLKCEM